MSEGFKPTDAMAREARRGLEWRKEFGRGGTAVGVARARDIVNKKNLSHSTIKRMFSFFSRHEVDKKGKGFKPGGEGYPSKGRIAWALWGGDPGFSWSRAKVQTIQRKELKMPIPYPLAEEAEQDFLSRCMNDEVMKTEFADLNDRLNVCTIQTRYGNEPKKENLSRFRAGFRKSPGHKVDALAGTIQEISLIEVGEARGHDLWIDQKSLETALEALGQNLPAYITHNGALEEDRILKEVGFFSDFFIDGEKLKARSFKALSSFRDDESDRFNRLFDIAQEMPDTFGVSLVFEAEIVHVFEDGSEKLIHEVEEDEMGKIIRSEPSVRFRTIKSADFVDAPASNRNGLFSAITKGEKMDEKLEQEIVEDVKLEEAPIEEIEENQESDAIDYEEKIKGLEERIAELEGKLSEEVRISERLSQMIEGSEPLDEDDDQEVVEEVSISEKFSQAQGAEATELFRANKSEILKSFNLARRR